jgi:multiple sugar transport system substrate-binding protein
VPRLSHRMSGHRRLAAVVATILLVAAAIMAAGVSVSKGAVGGAASKRTVQITLGYAGGPNIDPYYKQIIGAAEAALPNIAVKTIVYPTYDDQLNQMPQQVAAGTIPDIIVWDNSAPVAQYVAGKAIRPLNTLVTQAKINLGVDPKALVNAWTINGQLYGVPSYLQDSAFVYNLDMFNQAGIKKLPTTMAQVAADATLIKSKTGKAGLVILDNLFHLTQYVVAFGGGWNYGKTINSPQNVAGLQYLVNLFNSGVAIIPKQVGATWDGDALANNKAAMSDGGPWYIGFMQATAPKANYTLQPIPMSKGGHFVVTYGGAYTITSHAKDPADAIKLIKFLTNDASEHAILTSGFGFVPAMTKYAKVYRTSTPRYAAITDKVLANGKTLDYPAQTTQFENALVTGFEQIVFNHSGTVSSLLKTLQTKYGA